MAKMGSRKHLKTYKAPKTWPIHPKEDTWTVKPSAGSYSIENSLSLTLVIRDILKLADNSREAKRIINSGNVFVDGRVIKDYKFPVGFMDIIEIPKTGDVYRVLLDKKGRLQLNKIEENDSKLCKIVNKSTIKGGKIQVNLHDGKNVIIDENDYKEKVLLQSWSKSAGSGLIVCWYRQCGDRCRNGREDRRYRRFTGRCAAGYGIFKDLLCDPAGDPLWHERSAVRAAGESV